MNIPSGQVYLGFWAVDWSKWRDRISSGGYLLQQLSVLMMRRSSAAFLRSLPALLRRQVCPLNVLRASTLTAIRGCA
jgi:hypothetical protein